jgi:hypothetical protein
MIERSDIHKSSIVNSGLGIRLARFLSLLQPLNLEPGTDQFRIKYLRINRVPRQPMATCQYFHDQIFI